MSIKLLPAFVLLGCTAAGEPIGEPSPVVSEPSGIELATPPNLARACVNTNARWEAASGLSVDCTTLPIIIADAVPGELVPLLGEMPEGLVGATWPGYLIVIHPLILDWGQEGLEALVLHELAHWHGGWDSVIHPEMGDAARQGFHLPTIINEADLVWLCGFTECEKFVPETP